MNNDVVSIVGGTLRVFQPECISQYHCSTGVGAGAGVLIVILVALMILGIVYHKRKRGNSKIVNTLPIMFIVT